MNKTFMFSHIVKIIITALGVLSPMIFTLHASAQQHQEALRCSFKKEYARHNWLAYIKDDFDSTVVEWSYGEVRVDYPSDTQFVYLEMTREEFFSRGDCCKLRGIPTPGPDRNLGEAARTQVFSYREGSSLTFVRQISTIPLFNNRVRLTREGSVCNMTNWRDVNNVILPSDVRDTVEVALELVDASTRERLLLLDSVQMYATPDCIILNRRGTSPDACVHRLALPDQFANRRVYIRPLPYRYGPTPYGLQHSKLQSEWNVAHLLYDEHTTPLMNMPRWFAHNDWYPTGRTAWDTMQASYVGEYLRMHYSELGGDSCFPAVFANVMLPPERADEIDRLMPSMGLMKYTQRCFDRAKADTSWILSTLLPEPLEKQRQDFVESSKHASNLLARSVDGNLQLTLTGSKSQRNRVVIYDVAGAEIFRGTCPPAPFADVQIPLPSSVRGSVFVRCLLSDGSEVSTIAVLVR